MTFPTRTRAAASTAAMLMLWFSIGAAQEPRRGLNVRVSDATAPAIDRGIRDNDATRPAATAANEVLPTGARAEYLRGSLIVKFRAGTSAAARAAMLAMVGGTPTAGAVVRGLRRRPHRRRRRCRGRRAAVERCRPTSTTRRHATASGRCWCPTIRSTRGSGTTPRSTWSAPGTSIPERRRRSPWRCSTAAWPTAAKCCRFNASFSFRIDEGGPVFPALGAGRRPVCRGARPGRRRSLRRAARLHLGRQRPGRHRRPRHARRGHHRPADEQPRRRRRHGLQRQDHAGQGDRLGVGLRLRQPLLRHRRRGRARHPLRGRQRREGAEHEHRPQRTAGAGGAARRWSTPCRAAPSSSSPAATIS